MGLLTCARCGCGITAELKKGKYVYYHCTNHHGGCDNTYVRQEQLGAALANVIKPIQITREIANEIALAMRAADSESERHRAQRAGRLEQRRQELAGKLDRGYDDFVEGRISEEFWARRSEARESELKAIESDRARLEAAQAPIAITAQTILELAKQAENLYKSQNPAEQRRLLETVLSNCTFDAGTLCPTYAKPFDLLVEGNKTGDWLLGLDSNQQPSG